MFNHLITSLFLKKKARSKINYIHYFQANLPKAFGAKNCFEFQLASAWQKPSANTSKKNWCQLIGLGHRFRMVKKSHEHFKHFFFFLYTAERLRELRSRWPCALNKPVRRDINWLFNSLSHAISPPRRIMLCNNSLYIQFRLHSLPEAFLSGMHHLSFTSSSVPRKAASVRQNRGRPLRGGRKKRKKEGRKKTNSFRDNGEQATNFRGCHKHHAWRLRLGSCAKSIHSVYAQMQVVRIEPNE